MNTISLYVFLILIFLGLSKSFSPSEKKTQHIPNEKVLTNYFYGAPLSVILVDSFQTGFLIKTYFQKYKIVHGFKIPEEVTVRTTKEFWDKNLNNMGMSIFRREERVKSESTVPLPPGSLYIGDPAYGYWENADSGQKLWRFHRAYRHFPSIFHWGPFRPDNRFYKTMLLHEQNDSPYFGDKNEFGKEGSITKKYLPKVLRKSFEKIDFLRHMNQLFSIPKWKNEEGEQ